jgi:hypothetical protein
MNDEYADEEWIKDGAGPKLENYDKFVITENAFVFYFPPYQVSPYALGERQIVMPLNQLKEILNEEIFENYDFSLKRNLYIVSSSRGYNKIIFNSSRRRKILFRCRGIS